MRNRQINYLIPSLIFAALLPGATALAYYQITGDPTMRPLGITLSKLAENNTAGSATGLLVDIGWGRNTTTPNSRREVKAALEKALSVYGIDYIVRLRDTNGAQIEIFFKTGSVRLGPYRLADVASGIAPALAALQMSKYQQE